MAEALFRNLLKCSGKKAEEINVFSAGTAAIDGQPASPNAVTVVKERGADLESHRASMLTRARILEADLILTMTRAHKAQVLRMAPEAAEKTYTLKEYITRSAENIDISDPFGRSVEVYRQCADEIEEMLKLLLERI